MELAALPPETQDRVRRVLAATAARGFQSAFVPDRVSALETVIGLLPKGARVAHGSSTTLQEIGFLDLLKTPESGYEYLNERWTAESDAAKRGRLRARLSAESDAFLGSVQAVCETGEAIGADQSGSRQAFYVFGPPRVIWVAGINKIVPDVAAGIRRVREVALPKEDARMKAAGAAGSSIGKLVIYEKERPGRITLVLVGELLGF